jgi:GNAT superfamily N-acetyltransferase
VWALGDPLMKLYEHYKKKPYKLIGIAKHSESLKDLVVYETRYENSTAKLWVRPKEMFFEKISFEGREISRFAEIPLVIRSSTEVSDEQVLLITNLVCKIYGESSAQEFQSQLSLHQKVHLLLGLIEGQVVAFKLGYERNPSEFHSWLGGVLPEFRGVGVAADLLRTQHEWCRMNGYKRVLTSAENRFPEMLILNLRFGFTWTETSRMENGNLLLGLQKNL